MGGAERALCNMLTHMRNKSYQHHVAYFHPGPFVEELTKLGIPTYHIKGLVYRYDPWAYKNICSLVKKIQPNALHTSLWAANILGRLVGKKFNISVISDLHGNATDEGKLRNFLERHTAHLSTHIVAVSDSVAGAYRQTVIKAPKNLIVIKNGINPDTIKTMAQQNPIKRSDLGFPENAFVIGTVGRLEVIKSYDVLLKAFAVLKAPNSFLCIVGDGSQRPILEALAKQLGISHAVLFAGAQANPYPYYPLFDCFALSSTSEGLSLALLEALTFGLPVVTTHNNQTHDVLTHGTHGFLVPPAQPTQLANALNSIITNPEIANAMRVANAHLIDEHYHIQRVVKQYNSLFTNTSA